MKNLFGYLFVITFAISFLACSSDPISESSDTDSLLRQALNSNGGLNDFVLPESSQFDLIPQDPKNPITKEKVALGGFLFHETALSIDAKEPGNKKTFSCASCHHAAAGFQAGTFQGIGEGGVGFGLRGEGRTPASLLIDVDVQPVRSPSAMNGAYQPNQLWRWPVWRNAFKQRY
jgi:cytochrome c peroxidase